MLACAPSSEEKSKYFAAEKVLADSAYAREVVSSVAAVETNKDTARKFIRTAELKFRVKNVARTTYQIEDLINYSGGFVVYTNLISNTDYKTITPVSADSSLETIHYTVSNTMKVRVPNTKLDSTLKSLANFFDYLDYRVIKANDVGLQIMTNRLTQNRVSKHEERLKNAIDTRGKKLGETTTAEENLLNKQEQADDAKISNLSLQDQINFSTIELLVYQRQAVNRSVISNDKNIDAYEPGFGSQVMESLKFGWDIIEKLIVFVVKLWGLIVFAIVIYILFKKFGDKLKKKN